MDTNIENEPKGISKIIPATIKRRRDKRQRHECCNKRAICLFAKIHGKIIKQISEEILQGNIEVKPYYNASTKTPCEYCKYKSICRFDENTKTMNINIFQN